jgi:hypothetical protein
MSAGSWSRFFWSDWRSDPKLRACSIAARGLWIELLAIMAEASPRGYLLVNGQKPDIKLIRTLAGLERNHIGKLLEELEQAGVSSRTEDGVIFSRRMVRDEEKTSERRRCGALGGNPDLKVKDKLQDKVEDNLDLKSARARPSPSPSPERKKEEEVGARKSAAPPGGYAFKGEIICLTKRQLEQWRKAYHTIPDLEAELTTIDAKFSRDPPKHWFGECSGWLRTRHERLLKAQKANGERPYSVDMG